ncbi:hypothetical protein, partial [Dyadobacter pollutisoli]|uniref:hypothetical protein n=1 Tax=Dyadobacter pollutisoli TaxID=2910158 RepID=UPI001FD5E99C
LENETPHRLIFFVPVFGKHFCFYGHIAQSILVVQYAFKSLCSVLYRSDHNDKISQFRQLEGSASSL